VTQPVVLLDLDGVVWLGDSTIPGSPAAVHALRAHGARVAFFTNNSSMRVAHLIEKLHAHGISAEPEDVLSSAQAAADLLSEGPAQIQRVLPCAGPGVIEAVEAKGMTVVHPEPTAVDAADAVVVGWHRTFDFDELDRASAAVRGGARFVATNLDATYPAQGRVLPGGGAIVAAVATASGVQPEVAGKPEAPAAAMVHRRLGNSGVMVGDRPSTDGAFADALGWPFALVLSGIGGHDPAEPIPKPEPPFVADDLAAIVPAILRHLKGIPED
jgi:4-nitrophenyl phosphatase